MPDMPQVLSAEANPTQPAVRESCVSARNGAEGGIQTMENRVDRLRLCGNGVVPLAAAYAFCTLLADLTREQ